MKSNCCFANDLRGLKLPKAGYFSALLPLILLGWALAYPCSSEAAFAGVKYDLSGNLAEVATNSPALPMIVSQPLDGVASFNEGAASFSVNVTSDSPVTYQWRLDGHDISGATGDSYYLPLVTAAHEGNYTVIVTNAQGSVTSAPATLGLLPRNVVAVWGNGSSGQKQIPPGLSDVRAVAAGRDQCLALRGDGSIAAWGGFALDQTSFPGGRNNVVAIAAGYLNSLALRADGTVSDTFPTFGRPIPVGLDSVVAVAAGYLYNVALRSDGSVLDWGGNADGPFINTPLPLDLDHVVAIATSGSGPSAHWSVALRSDGTVAEWGDAGAGPVLPEDLTDVVAIAAGGDHVLVLKADGTVLGFGSNLSGETTVPAGLANVVAIAAGQDQSLALKSDGTVVAWGSNASGEATVPAGLGSVVAIAAGKGVSMAAMAAATASTAPIVLNTRFAMADRDSPFIYRILACNSPTSYDAAGLPAGVHIDATTGVITGTPMVAGSFPVTLSAINSSGTGRAQITLQVNLPLPRITSALLEVVGVGNQFTYQITATNAPTGFHAVGLPASLTLDSATGLISGSLTAVGTQTVQLSASNENGTGLVTALTLNVQRVIQWNRPFADTAPLPEGLSNVVALASAGTFSLALNADGTVVSWGDGILREADVPPGLSNVVSIATAQSNSLALRADGRVVGWGNNVFGLSVIPAGLNNVVAIASGGRHHLALKADGTVVAWGIKNPATKVPAGLSKVVAIAAGEDFSLALKSDGKVVGWGVNDSGGITIPTGLNNVVAIAAGLSFSLALKSDGTVVGWGVDSAFEAVKIPAGLSNVVAIAAGGGGYRALALKGDGTVVDLAGPRVAMPIPTGVKNVIAISAGGCNLALVAGGPSVPQPVIINPPFALAGLNVAFNFRIRALHGPTSYAVSGLPDGLHVDPVTGQITGKPTVPGRYPITLSATNGAGTGQLSMALTVNPQLPATSAGAYDGLVTNAFPTNGNTGYFTAKVTATGTFTGKLVLGGIKFPLVGKFLADGSYTKTIPRRGLSSIVLNLVLDRASYSIVGSVSAGTDISQVEATIEPYAALYPAKPAGAYTLLFPQGPTQDNGPRGKGFAVMTVTKTGTVTLAGHLGDDTHWSVGGLLKADGSVALYTGLYGAATPYRGSIGGTLIFRKVGELSDCDGAFQWYKPAQKTGAFFKGGFTTSSAAFGATYTPPLRGSRALDLPAGTATLSDGNIGASLAIPFTIDLSNKAHIDPPNPHKLSLTITSASGLIRGSFLHPVRLKSTPFTGVLIQKQKIGGGVYLGTDASGSVELAAP